MQNLKETNILLTKWKLLSKEKPLRGRQTQKIHYVVVIPLTLTRTYTRMPPNQVSYLKGSSIDSFSLGLLPKLNFNGLIKSHK
jgi:hypothetical protein